ncbi:MAG: thiol-disulfide oxidoreductase DCC family protein [Halobacteria archaeon]|nr:thiol-disulfide oxidoreductase DCC family protein [Halobacteria archaeon]
MVAEIPEDKPIVLFDGVCNLCNGFIQFIIPRDPEAKFRFAPLQSEVGNDLLEGFNAQTEELESIVLVEGDRYYKKSSAVLRILKHIGGVYSLLYPLRFIPRPIRDYIYDFVADHRYGWFGKKDQCMVPSPENKSRFLEQS